MDKINIARHRREKKKSLSLNRNNTNMFPFNAEDFLEPIIMEIFPNFKITHNKIESLQPLYFMFVITICKKSPCT